MLTLDQRRAKAESLKLTAAVGDLKGGGREVRSFAAEGIELRDNGDGTLELTGHACVTEREYDMGWYMETIARDAFDESLSRNPDVQMLINHTGLPIARTIGGTLRLSIDEIGLRNDATLDASDPDVQQVARKKERNLIDQESFAFSGARSEWNDDMTERRILSLDIHRGDVSLVNQGANPATSFTMRSLADQLIDPSEEALAELRELLGPDNIQTLIERLMPVATEVPVRLHDLDFFRALVF